MKSPPNLIIFFGGTEMDKRIELCEVHSVCFTY